VDPDLIIPNPSLSIEEGGICASSWGNVRSDSISRMYFEALAKKYKFKLTTPIKDLSEEAVNVLLYGTGGEKLTLHYERERGTGTFSQPFEGIVNNLKRRYQETQSPSMRSELEQYMSEYPCPDCGGKRLKDTARAVTVGGMGITDFTDLSVKEELRVLDGLALSGKDAMIADRILKEKERGDSSSMLMPQSSQA